MSSTVGKIKVKLNLDSAAYEQGINAATRSMKALSASLGALGIGFGAVQIKNFISEVSKASVRMDGLTNKFSAAAGGAILGANSLQFVRDEAQELGLVFVDTAESFSGFEAAALRSGLTLEQTKTIFDDIARTATSLHLSGDRTALVFRALEQMASKGVVSMEELRRQLGDSLPGAFEIAAKSMGVTTAEFNDMVSNGEVMSAEFLPKFSKAIREELGSGAEKAATQANAAFNRFHNSLFDIKDTLGDGVNPALADLATNATSVVDSLNEDIKATQEWAAANQTTVEGLKDLGVAIAALAVGIPVTNATVTTIITTMRSFGVITASTSAYQIAFATLLKGEASLALIQYRAALSATIIQVKALTVALLANPLTWVTLALGAGALAWWQYQQNVKSTERAIKDLNATQDQQVTKTVDAISTIKDLQDVKKLDYEQTKRLDSAIAYLTDKYPGYINKLRQELKLKGEISKATAEQIANEMTLSKVKGLQEERVKLNKDMMRDMKISSFFGRAHAGGRYGITKANQRRDDALIAERKKIEAERQSIINELTKLNEEPDFSSFSSGGKSSKKQNKKQLSEEKKKQKEALEYKLALLDIEKYKTYKTEEEIYQLELKQANLKIQAAKKGTSEYAQALAQKYALEREHDKKIKALKSQQLVDDLEYNKQELNSVNSNLELQYEAHQISKTRMLEAEIVNISRKKALEQESLKEQLKLIQGNAAEEIKIKRASNKEQEELDRELVRKQIELQDEKQMAFNTFSDGVSSGWGNTVKDLISGDVELTNAFSSITDTLVNAFANACGQMVENWLVNHMSMAAITDLFAVKKITTNAAIIGSNKLVSASTKEAAGSSTAMGGAMSTLGSGITTILGPITQLAGVMASLAASSVVVAIAMPVIAVSTAVVALSSALAALSLGILNATMLLTAPIVAAFAPVAVLLAAEFALIGAAALIAAEATAQLAIALAAASAAAIPMVGWTIAPAAAMATGTAINAANTMVQFREKGGSVKAGQPYIVGEKRPELFIPDRNGTILPDTSTLGGGGDSYQISVVMPISSTDVKSFEGRIDELTNRIHTNLFKGIKKRQLKPLGA